MTLDAKLPATALSADWAPTAIIGCPHMRCTDWCKISPSGGMLEENRRDYARQLVEHRETARESGVTRPFNVAGWGYAVATENAKGQLDAYRPSAPPLKRSHRGFSILSYSGLKARHPVSPWLAQRRRAKTAICFDAITLRHETTNMRSGRFAHKDAQKCFSSVARLRLNNRERCRFCACLAQLVTRSRHNADSTVRRFRNASATAPLFCLGGIPIDGRFSWHSPDNRECAKRVS